MNLETMHQACVLVWRHGMFAGGIFLPRVSPVAICFESISAEMDGERLRLTNTNFWGRLLFVVLVALLFAGCSIIPRDCRSAVVLPLCPGEQGEFEVDLASKCNRSGIRLDEKSSYWFEVEAIGLLEDRPVICNPPGYKNVGADCCKPLGPEGYLADELPWCRRVIFRFAEPFRPMNDKDSRWLETVGRVAGDEGGDFSLVKYSSGDRAYQPSTTGELLVLANDFPWFGRYANNRGTLRVTVHSVKAR